MPNTKSAERRMRSSARKQARNRGTHSRLHSLENTYLELAGAGKPEDAAKALRAISSALDKAAKTGAVPKSRADRKKSRLTIRLNKMKAPAPVASAPVAPAPAPAAAPAA